MPDLVIASCYAGRDWRIPKRQTKKPPPFGEGSLFGGVKRDYSAASCLTPSGSPIRALCVAPLLVNRVTYGQRCSFRSAKQKNPRLSARVHCLVELSGIEPLTSTLPVLRSPS